MWRIVLFFGLFCSVALNVYLFMQLKVSTIENKIQQEVNMYPQQGAVWMKKGHFKNNVKDKGSYIESTKN